MLLVRLQDGPPQWDFIKNAAHIIFQASAHPSTTTLLDNLRTHYSDQTVTVTDLHTGINDNRKAVLVSSNDTITIAFEGSADNELWKNTWTMARSPR
jgi:hypothetical protein